MVELRIGISGWTYPPWRKTFFPEGLPQKKELAYASTQVNSIEINGTFYSLQRPSSYQSWREQTPPEFVFAVKAPRFVTHIRRLRDVAGPLANFFASGVLGLNEKLGPILWQLPPSLPFEPDHLAAFLDQLPRTTRAAASLARRHDSHLRSDPWTKIDRDRPLRHALEIRHASFVNDRFVALLRAQGVALVVADTAGKWPLMEEDTSDFAYVRLHGDEKLYVSGYTEKALHAWAAKIRAWRDAGRSVFVYFDNDVKVRAPFDAMALAFQLGLSSRPRPGPAPESIAEEPRAGWPAVWGAAAVPVRISPSPRKAKSGKTDKVRGRTNQVRRAAGSRR